MRGVVRIFMGLVVCMMVSGNAMADQTGPKFKLGVGTYGVMIQGDSVTYGSDDDTFLGGALVGTVCFTPHIAVRGSVYATEHEDDSDLELNGVDIQLLLGTNFYKGFNAFVGIGYFSETMEITSNFGGYTVGLEEDFSGAEASFGLGYSWSRVSLDYVVSIRDTSDYEDFVDKYAYGSVDDIVAISAGITLSYIF